MVSYSQIHLHSSVCATEQMLRQDLGTLIYLWMFQSISNRHNTQRMLAAHKTRQHLLTRGKSVWMFSSLSPSSVYHTELHWHRTWRRTVYRDTSAIIEQFITTAACSKTLPWGSWYHLLAWLDFLHSSALQALGLWSTHKSTLLHNLLSQQHRCIRPAPITQYVHYMRMVYTKH